jgi:hypothetical protein
MDCFFCRGDAGRTNKDVKAVLCGTCVQKLVNPPDLKPVPEKLSPEAKAERKQAKAAKRVEKLEKLKTAARGRGRGWHLKKLFEFEGQYFSMGKAITAAEALKLRKALAKTEAADPFKLEPKRRGRPRKAVS